MRTGFATTASWETTNAGGANAPWLPRYTQALRGREVVLIPDNDPPGRQRVVMIARALLGHAARIIVLELSDGKDVSDWFDRGHSEVELVHLIEKEEKRDDRTGKRRRYQQTFRELEQR